MYRVVIVDDEETIVTGLRKLLPWADYRCEVVGTATNGVEALALAKADSPHILFTDIAMPGMDGLTMIAALRSEYPTMEIAILSGYPYFSYAQKAIELGVTGYIIKPSRMEELETILAKMVMNLDHRLTSDPTATTTRVEAASVAAATSGASTASEAVAGTVTEAAAEAVASAAAGTAATEEVATSETADEEPTKANNFICNEALKFMQTHFAQPLTLTEVAEHVYVSPWHLSKLLSRYRGQNFNEILNHLRIEEAKVLLRNPAHRINDISEQVGFSDVAHFSRTFKKFCDVSPNEYRNQL